MEVVGLIVVVRRPQDIVKVRFSGSLRSDTLRCVSDSARDLAWRLHTLQEAWISRVDVKASILLALEGGFLIAAFTTQVWLADGSGQINGAKVLVLSGIAALTIAVCLAGGAVLPILRSARQAKADHGDNAVYFGHIMHWQPAALAAQLSDLSSEEELAMVTRQVIIVSRINWLKHRLLQCSVVLTLVAFNLMAIGILISIN
jgi:hypothetical protein